MNCRILVLVFILFSCKDNHTAEQRTAAVPAVFQPKSLATCASKNNCILINGKRYNGFLYQLYENESDTLSVEAYTNGVLDGISKKYYLSGKPMEWRQYRNGAKNGKQISYWENGNKRFEFVAIEDAYEGELKEWSEDGRLIHLGHFKNGQEEGVQKLWYDNGKIRANYVIKNGRRYGLLGTKNCKNASDPAFIDK